MYVFSISIWSYKTPTNRTSTKHICWKGGGKRARGMLNRKLIIRLTTKTTTKRLFIIKHIMSPKVSKVFFVNLKVKHNCLRLTIQQLISLKKKGGIVCYCYKTIYFSYKIFIFSFPHQQKKHQETKENLSPLYYEMWLQNTVRATIETISYYSSYLATIRRFYTIFSNNALGFIFNFISWIEGGGENRLSYMKIL